MKLTKQERRSSREKEPRDVIFGTSSLPFPTMPHRLATVRDNIVLALGNGPLPVPCVTTAIGYMADAWHGGFPEWQDQPAQRIIMHEIFSACWAWLTRPRTKEQLQLLHDLVCTCSSTEKTHVAHRAGDRALGRQEGMIHPGMYLVSFFLLPLSSYFIDKTQKALNHDWELISRIEKRTYWPTSLNALLPHGAEATTRSLISLYTVAGPSDYSGLHLSLRTLLALAHTLVLPVIITSKTFVKHGLASSIVATAKTLKNVRPNIDAAVVEYWDSVVWLVQLSRDIVEDMSDREQRKAYHRLAPQDFLYAYKRAIELCSVFRKRVTDNARLTPNITHTIRIAQVDEMIAHYTRFGAHLFDDFAGSPTGINLFMLGTFVGAPFGDVIDNAPEYCDEHVVLWDRLRSALHVLVIRQRCAAPGCSHTRRDGPLQRCSGCHRVHYCSRRCQKRAWKHGVAHRNVCGKIGEVTRGLRIRGYDVPASIVFHPWMAALEPTARVVVDHFAKLTRAELKTDCKLVFEYDWVIRN
jgi:hypothetical protein